MSTHVDLSLFSTEARLETLMSAKEAEVSAEFVQHPRFFWVPGMWVELKDRTLQDRLPLTGTVGLLRDDGVTRELWSAPPPHKKAEVLVTDDHLSEFYIPNPVVSYTSAKACADVVEKVWGVTGVFARPVEVLPPGITWLNRTASTPAEIRYALLVPEFASNKTKKRWQRVFPSRPEDLAGTVSELYLRALEEAP